MKKNITKEQVLETALGMMAAARDFSGLNLRAIARELGCAHTNLYHYFPSHQALLWEAHIEVQRRFLLVLEDHMSQCPEESGKLTAFFGAFVTFYLEHPGWFRLVWLEHLGDSRPEVHCQESALIRDALDQRIADIYRECSGNTTEPAQVAQALHDAHCYIIGECSNHISGRGVLASEVQFRQHVTRQAAMIFSFCLRKE